MESPRDPSVILYNMANILSPAIHAFANFSRLYDSFIKKFLIFVCSLLLDLFS